LQINKDDDEILLTQVFLINIHFIGVLCIYNNAYVYFIYTKYHIVLLLYVLPTFYMYCLLKKIMIYKNVYKLLYIVNSWSSVVAHPLQISIQPSNPVIYYLYYLLYKLIQIVYFIVCLIIIIIKKNIISTFYWWLTFVILQL